MSRVTVLEQRRTQGAGLRADPSEARLDDTQALDALISYFRNAEKEGPGKGAITNIVTS